MSKEYDNARNTKLVTCGKCGKNNHFTRGCAANRGAGGATSQDPRVMNPKAAEGFHGKDQLPKSIPEQSPSEQSPRYNNVIKLYAVTPTCASVLLGILEGKIQFMIDTGNWSCSKPNTGRYLEEGC